MTLFAEQGEHLLNTTSADIGRQMEDADSNDFDVTMAKANFKERSQKFYCRHQAGRKVVKLHVQLQEMLN